MEKRHQVTKEYLYHYLLDKAMEFPVFQLHRHHLRVLARLMRILDADTVATLMQAEDREEFLQTLIDKEEAVLKAMK